MNLRVAKKIRKRCEAILDRIAISEPDGGVLFPRMGWHLRQVYTERQIERSCAVYWRWRDREPAPPAFKSAYKATRYFL